MAKTPKAVAGYQHKYGTDYLCMDCFAWSADQRCFLHSPDQLVVAVDTCNYFSQGAPLGLPPIGALNAAESGLARRPAGAGCKRCVYWSMDDWKCERVDESSEGDDFGLIHPDACCNWQEPDPERGAMNAAQLRAFGVYENAWQ